MSQIKIAINPEVYVLSLVEEDVEQEELVDLVDHAEQEDIVAAKKN